LRSVSAIRIFLEITGYPQIGSDTLHIAHVLWGGLLLFASSLLPLIFVNKRILDISALLSGIGVGFLLMKWVNLSLRQIIISIPLQRRLFTCSSCLRSKSIG